MLRVLKVVLQELKELREHKVETGHKVLKEEQQEPKEHKVLSEHKVLKVHRVL